VSGNSGCYAFTDEIGVSMLTRRYRDVRAWHPTSQNVGNNRLELPDGLNKLPLPLAFVYESFRVETFVVAFHKEKTQ